MESRFIAQEARDGAEDLTPFGMTIVWIAIVALTLVVLHLNPHPLKAKGAAPKCRLAVGRRGGGRCREHRNGLEGGDLLGSLLWLHL
jgi:hypothetical protein